MEEGFRPRSELLDELRALRRRVAELQEIIEQSPSAWAGSEDLQSLCDRAPIGLCLIDRDLRFRLVNEHMAAINGVPVRDHIGARVEEVIPALADRIVPLYQRVLATGEPNVNREIRGCLPSDPGVEHAWIANDQPLKDADGKVRGIVTSLQDVTHLRRTADGARDEAERLAEAQRLTAVGSWEWDLLDNRQWWSDELFQLCAFERPYPAPSFEFFMERVHPDDRAHLRASIEALFAGSAERSDEFRYLLEDGSEVWFRSVFELERGKDGTPLRLFGTAQRLADVPVEPH